MKLQSSTLLSIELRDFKMVVCGEKNYTM